MSHSQKIRRAAMLACGMLALSGAQALAANQDVNGTVESYLALTSDGNATVAPFHPDTTALGFSGLHATSTEPSWAISFSGNEPGAGTAGKMDLVAGSCVGATTDSELTNALTVVDESLTPVTINDTPQLFFNDDNAASNVALVTSYSVAIPAAQVLSLGCQYKETVTYTIAVP